ncbi:MAG TPA: hypothetical protein VH986_14820 [Acidimicrobiia bacterium]
MGALPLATELLNKGLWYPTILGVLVVVAAIVLFCGSIYVLLGTNLGARLGFLVAFTGLMGFMCLLTLLWCTTASPLNTLKGRIPAWEVQQVVKNLDDAKTVAVHNIESPGNKVDTTEASNVKAAVDAALVPKVQTPTTPVGPNDNRFAIPDFTDVTKYLVSDTWEIGGSNPQFWKLQFSHEPQYAVAKFCAVKAAPLDRPVVLPPLPPECDPGGQQGFVILKRDLGSLRVPPFIAFGMSLILFVLGLLLLHWRERDEMTRSAEQEQAKDSEPRPTPVPAKV